MSVYFFFLCIVFTLYEFNVNECKKQPDEWKKKYLDKVFALWLFYYR